LPTTVLVVEDELKIREMISRYLSLEGYTVIEAEDGPAALHCFRRSKPDMIILDLMLPRLSGEEVCRAIRQESKTPIIMLTAKTGETDTLIGLELGADDYMSKPFSLRELSARIRAVLRRAAPDSTVAEPVKRRGDLEIDVERHMVLKGGVPVDLTPTEFNLLVALSANPGKVFSRLQLLNIALGEAYANYERSIDTHISNLRKKIEDDKNNPKFIITVFGIGYKFGDDV
jgi:DNA-binding response OmpR family regulator